MRPQPGLLSSVRRLTNGIHRLLVRRRYLSAIVAVGIFASVITGGIRGDEPTDSKKRTVNEVMELWSPNLKSATDYHQMGGIPKQSPDVAAYAFRVVGPTYEELWNHYAHLCGLEQRYEQNALLVTADSGPKGSYVVSDRAAADGTSGRGLSVFLLKTNDYTVTVTFSADPSGKSISGSLSAVVE